MQEADIRKYALLMKELELTGLEITEDNRIVRLERTTVPSGVRTVPSEETPADISQATDCETYVSVKSPIVGIFYAAPAENADPYVSLGDSVKIGQTLCIVEAMKLMNEIGSDTDGVIDKICVANGQMVEYGTELFRIRRDSK